MTYCKFFNSATNGCSIEDASSDFFDPEITPSMSFMGECSNPLSGTCSHYEDEDEND